MKVMHKPLDISTTVHRLPESEDRWASWRDFLRAHGEPAMYCDPEIIEAIATGLRQEPFIIEATRGGDVVGLLPAIFMRSALFGRFLVSVPYVNWGGVICADEAVGRKVLGTAIRLAEELDTNYLELRQLEPLDDDRLVVGKSAKVQMRLPLGAEADENWRGLKSEVRTQIRKAAKHGLQVSWGRDDESIRAFYEVFSRNMRDLGTPVFPLRLFRNIAAAARDNAEFGVVRLDGAPIAACLAIHGPGLTEIPSAAALRAYRKTAANSLMYWNAIERAIERGQTEFDFGRSTLGGATYIFKKKWGATARPVTWQYYLRRGDTQSMRPDNRKFALAIQLWQRLPVAATRVLGPMIVRGIP